MAIAATSLEKRPKTKTKKPPSCLSIFKIAKEMWHCLKNPSGVVMRLHINIRSSNHKESVNYSGKFLNMGYMTLFKYL